MKQYKRGLSRWRLHKNIKLVETRAILNAKDRRKNQDKRSEFSVRGQRVRGEKFARYKRLLPDPRKPRQFNQAIVDQNLERNLAGRDRSQVLRSYTPTLDDPNLEKLDTSLANGPELNKENNTSDSQGLKRENAFSQEKGGWCCPHPNCTEYPFDRFGDLEAHFLDHFRSVEIRQKDNHPAPSMLSQISGWTPEESSYNIPLEIQQYWSPFDEGPLWAQWITDVSTWVPQYPVNNCSLPLDPVIHQNDGSSWPQTHLTMEDLMAQAAELFKETPVLEVTDGTPDITPHSGPTIETIPPDDVVSITRVDVPQPSVSSANKSVKKNAKRSQSSHVCARINKATGEFCNLTFSRGYDRKRHNQTVHGDDNPKVRCMICGGDKKFARKDGLFKHLRLSHPNVD